MPADYRMIYLGSSGAAVKQSLICFAMALGYSAGGDFVSADQALAVGKHNLDRATHYIRRAHAS